MMQQRVILIESEEYLKACDQLPSNKKRASTVHSLIRAYGLIDHLKIVKPIRATFQELKEFHDEEFLHFLETTKEHFEYDENQEYNMISDESEDFLEQMAQFGLEDDCPIFDGMYDYVTLVAGATLTAARELIHNYEQAQNENRENVPNIAINWNGGRHHARLLIFIWKKKNQKFLNQFDE